MIEKSKDPDANVPHGANFKSSLFRTGVVVLGLSVGLFIIGLLVTFHALGNSGATPVAILGICGGLSLIIANQLGNRKIK